MESGAVEGLIQSVFEGCISMKDMEIERRPYHRNCSCALHKRTREGGSSKACSLCGKVSFPVRRSQSDGSLLTLASQYSSRISSASSSPAHGGAFYGGGLQVQGNQIGLCKWEED
ncbi:hypothetical protein NE237_025922 [Protea cynaroides]|uniref:Uncharacterized protein n=1 Tax=Protea cynaroides TaxID=273540 RepID=A0A9Q0H552_9MAGN|nr:hypothetical protein NE237_025922 [Protea cynaroides]